MNKEPASASDISAAALKVFSREEIQSMPRQQRMNFLILVERRLNRPGPEPTLAELQGIGELVTEHLWHPALSRLSEGS